MDEFRNFISIPNIPLYKYFSNAEYAKACIKNSQIHLEKPSDYNDIYDSAMTTRPEDLSHRILYTFIESDIFKGYAKRELSDSDKKNYIGKSIQSIIDNEYEINPNINKNQFIADTVQYLDRFGVLHQADNNLISCFSEINDSMLMWAYYANNYKGVCLGFDFNKDKILQKQLHKVQYTKYFSQENNFNGYFKKSLDWSHEQEWRIVYYGDDEYLKTTALSSLYIGYRNESKNGKELITLAKKHNLNVYIMEPDKYEYKLNFVKI